MKNLLLIYYPRGEIYYLPARHAATAASDNRQISVFHPRMMPSLRRARLIGYSALGTGIRDMIERCRKAVPLSSPRRSVTKADSIPGPTHGAFGEKLWPLMDELNQTLVA